MAKKIKKFNKFNELDMENEKEVREFIDSFEIPMIKVKIPQIFGLRVGDYHEFSSIQHDIEKSIGLEYDYEEVGHSGEGYEAIFWLKSTPKPVDYIKAIEKTYEFDS